MISPALIGFMAAGATVAATITTQAVDGAGTSQNQLWILLSSVVTLLTLIITNIFLVMNEKRKRRWAEEDRRQQEERDRRAEAARREIKEDVKTVSSATHAVQTEMARNTAITEQTAHAVSNGFKNSVAESLKAAFDDHFNKQTPPQADLNKPEEHKPAG